MMSSNKTNNDYNRYNGRELSSRRRYNNRDESFTNKRNINKSRKRSTTSGTFTG